MVAVVTGAAGFVGSHLTESLLATGHGVVGVDRFSDYYDRAVKEDNLAAARLADGFRLVEADLASDDLAPLVEGADVVFHLAGQPGVRPSWESGFRHYVDDNVLATQRVLEAVRAAAPTARVVYASSSSIYGNAASYPCVEEQAPAPFSPYGVTKLGGEHLCGLYSANWGLSTVALRLFTVYGPRQRPDMAMHRLCRSALDGSAFPLYGDGSAERDFTYVEDVVRAFVAAADADVEPGLVCNVAGGEPVRLASVIDRVGELAGAPVTLDRRDAQPGDVARTGGSIDRAGQRLGWKPTVSLDEGLRAQVAWHRDHLPRP
jgi:nucleoside-diphosphate-sugar epimerase